MSFKEKIGATILCFLILCFCVGSRCLGFRFKGTFYGIIFGIIGMIAPWIDKVAIPRKVLSIELWEIDDTGRLIKCFSKLSKERQNTITSLFDEDAEVLPKSEVRYGNWAMQIHYKKKKDTIYPDKDDVTKFVNPQDRWYIVLEEEDAKKVHHIVSEEHSGLQDN